MKILTIEDEAWQELTNRITIISDYLKNLSEPDYDDLWLNNQEVCEYLHISKKTLWRMRTKCEITYSKIHGQYFYTLGAIKEMLSTHTVQSNEAYMQELKDKAKSFISKGRTFKKVNHQP